MSQPDLPNFGIVIPNYNQSRFLVTALESLRHQSAPFEVAVVDGGSNDGFREVIDQYSDVITFWRSAPDDGQAAAIQEGFAKVSGEIVAWLNADDYYFPESLDRVATFFNANPDVDIVYGDAIHVTPEGFFLSYFPPIQEFDLKALSRSCFICQPACFMRRRAYAATGGIDASLQYTMDWDLWHRLAVNGARFKYLPELLAAVRYYQGTKSLSGKGRRYKEIWRIERVYGGRFLPLSWPGFYRYDLFFKQGKRFFDKIMFAFLEALRKAKKAVSRRIGREKAISRSLYGFRRWDNFAEKRGIIHVPWYERERPWRKLGIQVEPGNKFYSIALGDGHPKKIFAKDGWLLTDVPDLKQIHRKITIECVDGSGWKLLNFFYDLK